MDFQTLAQTRFSVRAYKPDPVPEALLNRVLEAACLAPTACNRQPFQILVIPTGGRQKELLDVYPRPWFSQAPLLLGLCTFPGEAWVRKHDRKNYADVDGAIVMDHIIMAAADLGLGTCWVAAFDPAAARQAFKLAPEAEPLVFTPLGFPAEMARAKQRKPPEALVRRVEWS